MKEYKNLKLVGERALFKTNDAKIEECVFEDGESPLKESKNLDISNSIFRYKYPCWYCENVKMNNVTLFDMARSGIWYTKNISISNSLIDAPKQFRRASKIKLNNVNFSNALETMWNCEEINMNNVFIHGDYFGFNSKDIFAENITISGNYCFDGGKNIHIKNSKLMSKDAFWNCENVIVEDSIIVGEYLGWNSKNVTFKNCKIESLQGMCYMENLKLINCDVFNTTLAFEYSSVEANINTIVDSIKNPTQGIIKAKGFKEKILDEVDFEKVTIIEG